MNKYQERFMDSLTDEAINISKRFACGESLTPNEEWQKAEQAIRNGLHKPSGSNPTNGRMTGF